MEIHGKPLKMKVKWSNDVVKVSWQTDIENLGIYD